MERAAAFYVDVLGFEAGTRYARSQMLQAGDFRLLLHISDSGQADEDGEHAAGEESSLHLHLAVDDIDAFHEQVCAQGASPEGAPETKPWGLRSFEVRDPFGHVWEFVQEAGGAA